jgi:hypothetical protein
VSFLAQETGVTGHSLKNLHEPRSKIIFRCVVSDSDSSSEVTLISPTLFGNQFSNNPKYFGFSHKFSENPNKFEKISKNGDFSEKSEISHLALSVYSSSTSELMTNPQDGASQLLNASPSKHFNESISQKPREELLTQVVSGVYDHSNVVDDAIQDENRNPYVLYPGAQTLGIEKVVPSA